MECVSFTVLMQMITLPLENLLTQQVMLKAAKIRSYAPVSNQAKWLSS